MASSSSETGFDSNFDEQISHDETDSSNLSEESIQREKRTGRASSKKQRVTLTDAVSTILKKKSSEEVKPAKILSRRKAPERKLAEAKLEMAARRLLRAERLVHQDVAHVSTNLDPNHEKRLRKTATRGVVQIFNAIKQKIATKEQQEVERRTKKLAAMNAARLQQGEHMQVKEQGALQMSFLELLKTNMTNK